MAAAAMIELAAVLGLLANLLELESLFTAGIGGVIRLLAEVTAVVIAAAILKGRIQRGAQLNTAWIAIGGCAVVVITTLVLAPQRDQNRPVTPQAAPAPENSTAAPPITSTSAVTATVPTRSIAIWAADINQVCRQHLSTAGLALQDMQSMTDKLSSMVGSLDIFDPAQADQYVEQMTTAIAQTMPAMNDLNTAYLVIVQSSQSIEPPTGPKDADLARAWKQKYEQRAQAWNETVSHFRDFLRDTNNTVRGVDLFQAFLKSQAFVKINPAVSDLSNQAGIVSCP